MGRGGILAGREVPAQRGAAVLARGVLRTVRGHEAWECHEPVAPDELGRLAFSHYWSPLLGFNCTGPLVPLRIEVFARTKIFAWKTRGLRV